MGRLALGIRAQGPGQEISLSHFDHMSVRTPTVTIAIITCNRPAGLEKLLSALMQLRFPNFPSIECRVVVVENGTKLEAEDQVKRYRERGLDVIYAHEPTPGISYARNHAMDSAMKLGDYFAFIDDDEYPEPTWLDELLSCAISRNAPVVRGPVLPVYPEGAPAWAEQGGFFLRGRFPTGTEVKYGACNNVLIRSELLRDAGLRFDPRFALTGGEDTLLFLQLSEQTKIKIIWCDSAVVFEDLPLDRVSVLWLLRRAMREGSNMPQYDAVLGKRRFFRLRWILQGLVHIARALPLRCVGILGDELQRIRSRRELALGIGMIRGSFGGEINEYGERHDA